jgi:aspartyl-tRNA(Asn)/glutamyl-tRNA(Gln) amidotransferase subunit A
MLCVCKLTVRETPRSPSINNVFGRALGTDTGGSVRLPAAYTGTVGFKPSYGLLSRWGVVAYANSLDTVGILANKSSDARNIFGSYFWVRLTITQLITVVDTLNQYDPRDPTSLSPPSRSRISSYLASAPQTNRVSKQSLRIGVPLEYNISELSPVVRQAWSSALSYLEKQGHIILPVSLPTTKIALSAYYILAPAEASSNLAKYDGVRYGSRASGPDSSSGLDNYLYAKTRGEGFGPEVKRRILLGSFSLSADAIDNYFIQAQRVRRLVQVDFDRIFCGKNILTSSRTPTKSPDSPLLLPADLSSESLVDVLITPTAPSLPPSLSSLTDEMDSSSSSLNAYVNDVFTVPASLAGLPAVSVPVFIPGKVDGVRNGIDPENKDSAITNTVGIQIIGQYGDDHFVLKVGEMLESVLFV